MYQFKFFITENDYWEFNKFNLSHAPSNRIIVLVFRLSVPVVFLLMFFLSMTWQKNFVVLVTKFVVFTLFSVVWVIVAKPFFLYSTKKSMKLLKLDGKLPFDKDFFLQFDEESIFGTADGNESRIQYSSIEKILVGNSAIYVYMNAIQAILIPLSVFENDEMKETFLTFINNKTGK